MKQKEINKKNKSYVGADDPVRPLPKRNPLIKQNGITVVALVITIIIMLILAGVTVKIATGGGIIDKTKNASGEFEIAQEKEKVKSGYLSYKTAKMVDDNAQLFVEDAQPPIGNATSGWTVIFTKTNNEYKLTKDGKVTLTKQNGTVVSVWKENSDGTFTNGDVTLQVGDYVNYDEGTSGKHTPDTSKGAGTSKTGGSNSTGYTLGTKELSAENLNWRVLGVNDKGQLELISDNPTTQELYLANEEGWLNAEENLDTFCDELYGKGANASGARSLKVEDVNTLANYDPTTYSEYGVEWQYKFSTASTKVQYSKAGSDFADTGNAQFKYPGEAVINSSNPGTRAVKFTSYFYSAQNKIASNMSTDIANMITKGTTSMNISQWLSSRCVLCSTTSANFHVRFLGSGNVSSYSLFGSRVDSIYIYCRVRPVVTLKSDIKLSGNSNDGWTIN